MEAYPFQSNFTGYDDAGNPLYDRAVGASFMHAREKLYYTNGIFPNPSDNFQVMATDTMNIHIQPGTCFIEGITGIEDSSTVLTIEQAEELTTRTDTVVLRCDFVNRWVEVAVKKGTAELTRNGNVWELKLAEITVPKMALSITQANIVDTRLGSECGVVTGAVTTVDTSTLFAEYYQRQQYFLQMMADNEAAYNAWYDLFQTTADADMARINQDFADKMEEIDDWEQAEIARFVQMYKDNQAEFDALLITIKAAADARLQEQYGLWSSKMADYDAWYTSIKTSIFDSKYFDFNNNIYRAGHEYSYTETQEPHIFVETIKNSISGDVYAIRTSEESASGDWTIRTVCTEQSINMIEQWLKQPDGTWKGVFNRA